MTLWTILLLSQGCIYWDVAHHFFFFKIILSGFSHRVKYQNILSHSEYITCGVPQDNWLGPVVFLVVVSGIPRNAPIFAQCVENPSVVSVIRAIPSFNISLQQIFIEIRSEARLVNIILTCRSMRKFSSDLCCSCTVVLYLLLIL